MVTMPSFSTLANPSFFMRLTDRVLLVRPGRVEAVVQELQKMGHTPQVQTGS